MYEGLYEVESHERVKFDLDVEDEKPPASADFSLQQYMREVNLSPLLSHKHTVEIFQSIEEKQRNLDRLTEHSRCTPEQSQRISSLKRKIAELREQLVLSNLRLVVYLANRYRNRGVPIQDLVQEGNIGLIRAIEKFDYSLGFRFSTYATWWIRQGMLRAIHQHGRLIRIPTHMLEKFQRFMREGGSKKKGANRRKSLHPPRDLGQKQQDMIHLMEVMRDPLSLDTPMTEDGLDLQEVTRDDNQHIPEDLLIEQDLREKLREAISSLTSICRRLTHWKR
jgi:RNA polymerase primary sigma factor